MPNKTKIGILTSLFFFSVSIFGQSFSSLKIELITPGAKVYLDKVSVNENVLQNRLTVASGEHTISATLEGYFPFEISFATKKDEEKTISIVLEKDTKSTISFNSSLTGISGKINNSINLNLPSIQKLPMGQYFLSFSKPGFIKAEQTVSFLAERNYEVIINLSKDLPNVQPQEIGRDYKQSFNAYDFNKPETKIESSSTRKTTIGVIVGIVATITLAAVTPEGGDASAALVLGPLVGLIVGGYMIKPKVVELPDEDNIRYNREEVPKLLKEKNAEIDSYNNETKILVEVKQKQKYNESAISVFRK